MYERPVCAKIYKAPARVAPRFGVKGKYTELVAGPTVVQALGMAIGIAQSIGSVVRAWSHARAAAQTGHGRDLPQQ